MFKKQKFPPTKLAHFCALNFVLLCCLLGGPVLQAQYRPEYTFTVLTNTGVNLRKGPGTEHAKLATLPFGTIVKAKWTDEMLLCQEQDTMPPGCIKIEGRRGYWMEVTYKAITGYVFSGFGIIMRGNTSPNWTPDRPIEDYVMILMDNYYHATDENRKFDPRLHWYGLHRDHDGLEWVKVDVRYMLKNEMSNEELGFAGDLDNWSHKVIASKKNVLLLLGMRTLLSETQLKNLSIASINVPSDENTGDSRGLGGKLVQLNERFNFEWSGKPYQLHTFQKKASGDNNNDGTIPSDIGFELRAGKGDSIAYFNLAKMMKARNTWAGIAAHDDGSHTIGALPFAPALIWAGDLNQDGGLDLLLYILHNVEGCGYTCTYTLVLSKKLKVGYSLEKACHID